jgi:hypothetical protein
MYINNLFMDIRYATKICSVKSKIFANITPVNIQGFYSREIQLCSSIPLAGLPGFCSTVYLACGTLKWTHVTNAYVCWGWVVGGDRHPDGNYETLEDKGLAAASVYYRTVCRSNELKMCTFINEPTFRPEKHIPYFPPSKDIFPIR